MKVLRVEPAEVPYVVDIGDGLGSLQEQVGGCIECLYPYEDKVCLICNEEGKISGLPVNRELRLEDTGEIYDIICGNFLVAGLGESFSSLTEEQIAKYREMFRRPPKFRMVKGEVITDYPAEDLFFEYQIFQLNEKGAHAAFMGSSQLKRAEERLTSDMYDVVYHGEGYSDRPLDNVYLRFNVKRPVDFTGHSLSVSDVICLTRGGKDQYYFVDSFGFKEVSWDGELFTKRSGQEG